MAKYPFAEEARRTLEENGIGFNTDGSTFIKRKEEPKEAPKETQNAQLTPQNPINNSVSEPPQPNATHQQVQEQEREKTQVAQDANAKLLEMQRAEIERLRKQVDQYNSERTRQQEPVQDPALLKEIEDLKAKVTEYEKASQKKQFDEYFKKEEFGLENVDDIVAKELRDSLISPVVTELNGEIKALQERLAKVQDKFREPTPEEKIEANKRKSQAELVEKFPDFFAIVNSQEFSEKLSKQDPRFPDATYGHALQRAYEAGNTDFIVREINAFLGNDKPQGLSSIADVSATNGVGVQNDVPQGGSGFTYTDEETVEMLRKRQMGDITRQEYSDYLAKRDEYRSKQHK